MPGLGKFVSRSDAGFGCFTAVCTNALRWRATHVCRVHQCSPTRLGLLGMPSVLPAASYPNLQSCKL